MQKITTSAQKNRGFHWFFWRILWIKWLFGLALLVVLSAVAYKIFVQDTSPKVLIQRVIERVQTGFFWSSNDSSTVPIVTIEQLFPDWQPQPELRFAPEPQTFRIGMRTFYSAQEALAALKAGDTLDIGAGIYNMPLVIKADDVIIQGHGHVILEKGIAEGKGNLVIKSNRVQVKNIECRLISVADANGACIRFEGSQLLVEHVYFHDSDQGILTGEHPGLVHILDSRFQRLGLRGLAHGIYIGGGNLLIEDSAFLAAKSEGHEIKSRAEKTVIQRSIVASLDGVDSRLIDVSNGGTLIVEDSLLAQGAYSSNADMIGVALEGGNRINNRVVLRGNMVFLERQGPNRLLHLGNEKISVEVLGNVMISNQSVDYEDGNFVYRNRKDAGLPDDPVLPVMRFLQLAHSPAPANSTNSLP